MRLLVCRGLNRHAERAWTGHFHPSQVSPATCLFDDLSVFDICH
jgi:hypothetical protein